MNRILPVTFGGLVLCALSWHLTAGEGKKAAPLRPLLLAGAVATPTPTAPKLSGKLVFQRFKKDTSDPEVSSLYLYDFATRRLTLLSANWNIQYPRNAHFSPDGKKLVFMGIQNARTSWDVFVWTVGSSAKPVNLTGDSSNEGIRDEDPKFSPDGKTIAFKRGPRDKGDLYLMKADGTNIRPVVLNEPFIERSAPFFTRDGRYLLYFQGVGANEGVYRCPIGGKTSQVLDDDPGVQEYYPVMWKPSTALYVKWGDERKLDQVCSINFNSATKNPVFLPFNDPNTENADPYPANDRYVFFSSKRSGTKGGYDLYLGDSTKNQVWTMQSLGAVGLNSTDGELGVTYSPPQPTSTTNLSSPSFDSSNRN